jgi:hypothetical protein
MSKKTILLSLLSICFSLFLFSCKKNNVIQIPKKVNIKSVTILNFSESNSSGGSWDGSLQGSYPDVYFKLTNELGTELYTLPSANRKENLRVANLPTNWTSADYYLTFSDLEQGIGVSLYDYESLSSDEFMGGVISKTTFRSLVENGDLPTEYKLTYGKYSFKLGLEWVY